MKRTVIIFLGLFYFLFSCKNTKIGLEENCNLTKTTVIENKIDSVLCGDDERYWRAELYDKALKRVLTIKLYKFKKNHRFTEYYSGKNNDWIDYTTIKGEEESKGLVWEISQDSMLRKTLDSPIKIVRVSSDNDTILAINPPYLNITMIRLKKKPKIEYREFPDSLKYKLITM